MRASMSVQVDTVWTNQVRCEVEAELDAAHTISAQHIAELMIARLKYMVEEVRHVDARSLPEVRETRRRELDGEEEAERVRSAYDEMVEGRREPELAGSGKS